MSMPVEHDRSDALRVSVLSEALPYIQRFAGRRVVVKYGGAAMVRADLRDAVYRDLVLLASVGVKPVVVHGGGPEINDWLGRLQIEPQFRNGLRVRSLPDAPIACATASAGGNTTVAGCNTELLWRSSCSTT